MAEGNQRLLGNNQDQQRYSGMDIDDSKTSESPLVDGEGKSSLRINKRALVVFFGVTTLAAAVIIVSVFVTLYSGKGSTQTSRLKRDKPVVTIDDVLAGTYNPRSYPVHWISDDEYMNRGPGGSIDIINPTINSSKILVSAEDAEDIGNSKLHLSPNKKWIIFPKNERSEYRYSTYADYYIYNIKTKKNTKIKSPGLIQYVEWSPSIAEESVVFVSQNDMYYIKDVKHPGVIHRLTNSGKEHKIFNGVPDWVYQEEILNSDHALYFSKDGSYLTYAQFIDTKVQDFVFSWFGNESNQYISQHRIAYPKPGTGNPEVNVKVINLRNLPVDPNNPPKSFTLVPPNDLKNIDHYFVEIGWLTSSLFSIQWLNRDQNHSITKICQVKSINNVLNDVDCDSTSLQGLDQTVKHGWVDDKYMVPKFQSSKGYYLVKYPRDQGKDGKFIHIVKVDLRTGTHEAITSGSWEVNSVMAFDDKNEHLYISAAKTSKNPTVNQIYRVSIKDKTRTCLTCDLPEANGGESGYFSAQFSKKGKWYILHYQGPSMPWVRLYNTKDPRKVVILETNQDLKDKVRGIDPEKRTKIEVVKGDDNNDIFAKIIYPPDFDKNKKYAVLFNVYGGPATQNVLQIWSLGYETAYLSCNYDIIIVFVDARGTMGRGESYKHAVYRHLGKYEARDTISVAKFMQKQPYVDPDKIAIWGWSYGGYLSTYILGSQKSKVFKVAMAVAPVADWDYYDSIYTERYMGLPQNNPEGYKDSSVLPLVKNFKGVDYLIVHGTGDDNVHFQNAAQIVRSLTEAEIDYRVQFYTDRNHALPGKHTHHHLFMLMTHFLESKLNLLDLNQVVPDATTSNSPGTGYPNTNYPNYPQWPYG